MASFWPPIITAVTGFVGVLVGLLVNALLTPRTEERLRASTRTVLRTSLSAELTCLANLMRGEIKYVEETKTTFTWVPLVQSFQIYIGNIQNLGLLTPIEARKITEAYYQYQESAGYIAQKARDQPDKPAIGRHIPCDFEKGPISKQDVTGALDDIAKKAEDAAQELNKQRQKDETTRRR
jgi:hypothetical protein